MILILDHTVDLSSRGSSSLSRWVSEAFVVEKILVLRPAEDLNYIHQLLDRKKIDMVVLSGSKESCLSEKKWVLDVISIIQNVMTKQIPVLGICFGFQMIARALFEIDCEDPKKMMGPAQQPELGWTKIYSIDFKNEYSFFSQHFEEVYKLPVHLTPILKSERCQNQGFTSQEKKILGFQFHPERGFTEGEESLIGRGKTQSDKIALTRLKIKESELSRKESLEWLRAFRKE